MRVFALALTLLAFAAPAQASYTPTQALAVLTVATLPTCNAANRGLHYLVTDALTPVVLAAVVGGGAVVVPVVCNGSTWIVG